MSTKSKYQNEIEQAIAKVRQTGEASSVIVSDGAEAYAYPRREGRVAWGINSADYGFNVLRGIRRPDGSDEAEM